MHTVLSYPSIRAVSNASLYIYYPMEAANRWTQHLQNDFDFATRIPGRLIHGDGTLGGVLGAAGRSAAPLRVDSDAPLVGAKVEHRSLDVQYIMCVVCVIYLCALCATYYTDAMYCTYKLCKAEHQSLCVLYMIYVVHIISVNVCIMYFI